MPVDGCGAAEPRPPEGGGGPATLRVELGGGGAAAPAGLLGGGGPAVAAGLLGGGGPADCVGWLAGTVTVAPHFGSGHANDCPAAAASTVSSVRQVGHANFRSILGLMHQRRLLGEYGSYDANSTTNHAGA